MHSHTQKSEKQYPKRPDLASSPPDPNSSLARMLALVGERKKVLDVGCATGYFASLLGRQECDTVGIDVNPSAAEEARKFCTRVLVADLDQATLPELLGESKFDAIIFGDVLEHLREPVRTLDEARALLSENGYVVASLPNVSHGAVRLSLLAGRFDYQEFGILDDSHLRFFTAKSIDELFLSAGYQIEAIERVIVPIFGTSELVPSLERRNFDEDVVVGIESDPDSTTLQFVVKALPLSNNQRLRAISKRFFTANTELANARQQLNRREREIANLHARLIAAEQSQHELAAVRTEHRKLEESYRALEERVQLTDDVRGGAAGLQQRLDAMFERILAMQAQESEARAYARALEERVQLTDDVRGGAAGLQQRLDAMFERILAMQAQESEARAYARALEGELTRSKQQIAEAAAHASRLDAEILAAHGARDEARAYVERLERELAAGKAQHAEDAEYAARVEAELEAARAGVRTAEAYAAKLEAEIANGKAEIASGAAYAQRVEVEMLVAKQRAEGLDREVDAIRAAAIAERLTAGEYIKDLQQRSERFERACADLHGQLADVSRTADQLTSQVEQGIEARDELRARLSDAEQTDAQRAEEIARLERDLADGVEARDKLRAALADAEAAQAARQREIERLEDDLEAHARDRDELRERLAAAQRSDAQRAEEIARLERDVAEGIDTRDEVRAMLADAQAQAARSAEAQRRLAEALSGDPSAAAIEAERRGWEEQRAELEDRVRALEADAESARAEMEIIGRNRAGAEALVDRTQGDMRRLEAELRDARGNSDKERLRAEAAQSRLADLDAEIARMSGELAAMTVREEVLRTNLRETEHRLVAQTEALLVQAQVESAQLATLIDVVQSSRFWRLKRWLNRLRPHRR